MTRCLSEFQGREWMRKIGHNRKYLNQAKGEKSGMAKLIAGQVMNIRHHKTMTRKMAKYYALRYGISEGYVYHLRSSNPNVRRWKHI